MTHCGSNGTVGPPCGPAAKANVAPPRIVPLAPPLPTRHSGFLGLSQHGASLSATRLIRRGRFPSDCLLARVKSQSHRGRMSEAAAQTSCSDIPNGDLRCILQGDTIEKEARGLRCCSCPPDRRHCACGYISGVPNGYMSVVYLLFLQEQVKDIIIIPEEAYVEKPSRRLVQRRRRGARTKYRAAGGQNEYRRLIPSKMATP